MSLLPSRGPETSTRQEGEFEVVGVDEDVAPVLDALASDTARDVLNEIYENPGTPSEIADRLDMSIQKVSYHLEKLEDVELIAVAGTRYSEKGQEMKVYEPPDDPLVLFVGTEERKSRLRSLVRRVVPTIGALALGSLLMQRLFGADSSLFPFGGSSDRTDGVGGYSVTSGDEGDGGDGGQVSGNGADTGGNGVDLQASDETTTPLATDGGGTEQEQFATEAPTSADTAAPTAVEEATEVARDTPVPESTSTPTGSGNFATDEAVRVVAETADPGLEPGVAFFLGGVFALALVGLWIVYRRRLR